MEKVGMNFEKVKVDANILKAKGEDAFLKLQEYRTLLEGVQKAVADSESFWQGQAGELYRDVLQSQMKQVMKALETYADYPRQLFNYAGIYSETINRANRLAESVQSLELF